MRLLNREQLERRLAIDLSRPAAMVTYHPTTIARDTTREADALFEALQAMPEQLAVLLSQRRCGQPGTDRDGLNAFLGDRGGRVFVNLEPIVYWSLLRQVEFLLGNSSSGIIEAASFALPAVNVGIRQQGREHGRNVLDAEADAAPFWIASKPREARNSGDRSRAWRTRTGMDALRNESFRCSRPYR